MAKKILMVIPSLTRGGAESQLVLLASLLKESTAYQPHILALYQGGDLEIEIQEQQLDYTILNLKTSHKWMPLNIPYVNRFVDKKWGSHIHAVISFLFFPNVYGYFAAKKVRAKSIISIRNSAQFMTRSKFKLCVYNRLQDYIFKNVDYTVFNSKSVSEKFSGRIPGTNSSVIYNGLLVEKGEKRFNLPSPFKYLVLNVAHLKWKKDLKTYILAASKIIAKRDDVLFLNVGRESQPDYARSLYELVKELDIGHAFKFEGEKTDVTPYYSRADIYVQSSAKEGYPNTLIEAGFFGIPMVVTNVDGNTEAVADGENGMTVPPGDPDILAGRILELLDNPGLRERFGANAFKMLSERHDPQKMLNSYLKIMDEHERH